MAGGGFAGAGRVAWVGERGPELVRFLAPAQVYASHSSRTISNSSQYNMQFGATPSQAALAYTVRAEVDRAFKRYLS
jgi:hypothetical protein